MFRLQFLEFRLYMGIYMGIQKGSATVPHRANSRLIMIRSSGLTVGTFPHLSRALMHELSGTLNTELGTTDLSFELRIERGSG